MPSSKSSRNGRLSPLKAHERLLQAVILSRSKVDLRFLGHKDDCQISSRHEVVRLSCGLPRGHHGTR